MIIKIVEEIWADINGFEGLYQISNLGNVKALPKLINGRHRKERIMKSQLKKDGYLDVLLSKNNKRDRHLIHKLVAIAFIPNPNNYSCVNHKDENKINNFIMNLEWCDHKYNNAYGIRTIKASNSCKKSIVQMDLNFNPIKIFKSATDAAKFYNFNRRHISSCCNNRRKTHKGCRWKFAD